MTPSTVTQLAILMTFVLPGSVYQVVRAHLAGEVPANRDLSNRVLRALAASAALDSLYGIVLGPTLVRLLGGHLATDADHDRNWFVDHVRLGSLLLFALLFLVPTALAYTAARRYRIGTQISRARHRGPLKTAWGFSNARVRRSLNWLLDRLADHCDAHGGLHYDPTPTAWDWAVDHGGGGDGFVRVHTPGGWQGGMCRGQTYFSAFPDEPAVFVEEAWQLDESGQFVAVQPGSKGAWIPCADATTVEFLHPADTSDATLSAG